MTIALSPGRRITGWSCLLAGKIGSLLLLWPLLSSTNISSPIVANGLWQLLGSEGRPRTDGN